MTRPLTSLLVVCAALAAVSIGILSFWAERRIAQFEAGGLDQGSTSVIYSAPFIIDQDVATPPERLLERLSSLDYAPVKISTASAAAARTTPPIGGYVWAPPILTVGLRGFISPGFNQAPGVFLLTWHPASSRSGGSWSITDWSGKNMAYAALEPEVIAKFSGQQEIVRTQLEPREISPTLESALVAAEDRRFYLHGGLDARGIARALWQDARHFGHMQGGSTITQQLAKNLFLSPRRTLSRKILEAALSLYLAERFSKEDILALYLNHIYMGQDGSASVMGAQAAANFYFSKDQKSLTLGQCAMLAGLIRSPYLYNPFRDPHAALLRRNQVLNQMREQGLITVYELTSALKEPLGLRSEESAKTRGRMSDYFVAEVLRQIVARYGDDAVFHQGLIIHTTMDPLLQKAAQEAVTQKARPQGALIALDQESGAVLALSGGRDFGQSQFNRATQAVRQPGSAFKPFLYGAALEKGLTPATWIDDSTHTYSFGRGQGLWRPKNDEGRYYGKVSLRKGLALSLNAASLDLAQKVGVPHVIAFARKMGITSPLADNLSIMIGASDTTLIDLCAAYAPFSNGGYRIAPFLITEVRDSHQLILESNAPKRAQVISPALAYVMTSLLEGVLKEGTAKASQSLGWTLPSAGKTGTTNGGADAWFIGYTPQILAGVWVGADDHSSLGVYGASAALPVWIDFMQDAAQDFPEQDFAIPQGVDTATIDPQSGLLARWSCPTRLKEVFLAGTAPTQYSPLCPGGVKNWVKHFFGR